MTTPRFAGISGLGENLDTVVVIDVMRAFTTAAWALARGAECILLAADVAHALTLKASHPGAIALKDGAPADGFETVNSPGHVSALDFTGRTVVQTTTAGTRGALAARHARRVLCASFVVAGATARALRADPGAAVTYLVTGDDGTADEDLACAEYLAALVVDPAADVTPYRKRARVSAAADTLATGLSRGHLGVHTDDVDLCLDVDRFDLMAAADVDGVSVLRRAVVSRR
ncbi:2-phosphosulfolactate phosphatase [Actinoplanes sp. NPDC051859]|uniref:2-phosphosulfolactate phosphatase n=1 Tax=Actinoplanes sp. NPDC051859 TaxID=3363909 RepID=UPI0037B55BDF